MNNDSKQNEGITLFYESPVYNTINFCDINSFCGKLDDLCKERIKDFLLTHDKKFSFEEIANKYLGDYEEIKQDILCKRNIEKFRMEASSSKQMSIVDFKKFKLLFKNIYLNEELKKIFSEEVKKNSNIANKVSEIYCSFRAMFRDKIIKELSETKPNQFFFSKLQDFVLDYSTDITVNKEDAGFFPYFFLYRLSYLPTERIAFFLDFQLKNNYNNCIPEFIVALKYSLRQHANDVNLSHKHKAEIDEWMKLKESKKSLHKKQIGDLYKFLMTNKFIRDVFESDFIETIENKKLSEGVNKIKWIGDKTEAYRLMLHFKFNKKTMNLCFEFKNKVLLNERNKPYNQLTQTVLSKKLKDLFS